MDGFLTGMLPHMNGLCHSVSATIDQTSDMDLNTSLGETITKVVAQNVGLLLNVQNTFSDTAPPADKKRRT